MVVAVELIDRIDIADWPRLTEGLSNPLPYIRDRDADRLDGIQAWLATRSADTPSFVQGAVANFRRVLDDLLLVLNYDMEVRHETYWVFKWYHRGRGGTGSRREVEFFETHVLLIQNLTAELTRAINLVLIRARQADPRVLTGLGLATVDTGSAHAPMQPAQYSEKERRMPQPYPGLLAFPGVITSRDIGALGHTSEDVPRTIGDFGVWLEELLSRRPAEPSGRPPAGQPPFSLPRPTDAQPPAPVRHLTDTCETSRVRGLRPLRRLAAWFGRKNPTLADQIGAGLVVTVVGGLILAAIFFVIHVIASGHSKVPESKAHGPVARQSSSTMIGAVPGQIEGGNQALRFADLTRSAPFANPQHARPCDVVEYRLRLYNAGPRNLSEVRVAGMINTITAYRTIEPTVSVFTPDGFNHLTTYQGRIDLPAARTEAYVPGSTQLVNSAGRVVKRSSEGQLEDSITASGHGILVGTLAVGTTEYIQFRTRVRCHAGRLAG